MCDENKENYENKENQLPIKNIFGGIREFKGQTMKSRYTEANENGYRDSTLNKSTNSLLIT